MERSLLTSRPLQQCLQSWLLATELAGWLDVQAIELLISTSPFCDEWHLGFDFDPSLTKSGNSAGRWQSVAANADVFQAQLQVSD
jgi:hypothetical protein